MRRVLFFLLILTGSFVFARAQEKTQPEKLAYIFAELGQAGNSAVKRNFEEFDKKLNEDVGSSGYIINYGTPKEVAKREVQLRNSMNFRRYDAIRITFMRGVNNGTLKSVFWIVPAGAEPPKP